MADDDQARVEALIARWGSIPGGAERANFASFIIDLVEVLGVKRPEPAEAGKLGSYQFEAPIPNASFRNPLKKGSADLYKRGCFVMEAKQSYAPLKDETATAERGNNRQIISMRKCNEREQDRFGRQLGS